MGKTTVTATTHSPKPILVNIFNFFILSETGSQLYCFCEADFQNKRPSFENAVRLNVKLHSPNTKTAFNIADKCCTFSVLLDWFNLLHRWLYIVISLQTKIPLSIASRRRQHCKCISKVRTLYISNAFRDSLLIKIVWME